MFTKPSGNVTRGGRKVIPQRIFSSRRISFISALFIGQLALFISAFDSVTTSAQQRRLPRPEVGLEVILTNGSESPFLLTVYNDGGSSTLINRKQLSINDPKLAGDFTAIDVWANGEGNAVRVRLSIIYNDLSNQEWWKDKKEKVAGSLLIREGESARLMELAQFGIEPFEMRVIDARPVVIQPDQEPRVINNTKSLEVVRLERSLDRYYMWVKNNSSKNIVAYTILVIHEYGSSGMGLRNIHPPFAAGATSEEILISNSNAEKNGISIPVVIFDDGSFEGDVKLATGFLVNEQGQRIQAPHVLRMVEQALEADDAGMRAAFERLESQLWVIPEAIDKQSAIELLKEKYPSFDDKTIGSLYEHLKGGLYEARNRGLSPLGDIKSRIQESEQRKDSNRVPVDANYLRERLVRIKHEFEAIIGAKR